jgi:protein-tyrosine phosphatase
MAGYRDLHCHLLFGLDDGAKSEAETLEMARLLVELGYSHCAPSPHAKAEYAPPSQQLERLAQVQALLAAEDIPLTLFPNAEHSLLEPSFVPSVEQGTVRCIGGGKFVLVEAPYSSPVPALSELIFRIQIKGFIPLIAHPERCLEFERKGSAKAAVAAGAYLQLDMGAVTGRYGKTAKKLAEGFLSAGLYSVAATDLHSPLRAKDWVSRSIKGLESSVGAAAANALLSTHPAAILEGRALPDPG